MRLELSSEKLFSIHTITPGTYSDETPQFLVGIDRRELNAKPHTPMLHSYILVGPPFIRIGRCPISALASIPLSCVCVQYVRCRIIRHERQTLSHCNTTRSYTIHNAGRQAIIEARTARPLTAWSRFAIGIGRSQTVTSGAGASGDCLIS